MKDRRGRPDQQPSAPDTRKPRHKRRGPAAPTERAAKPNPLADTGKRVSKPPRAKPAQAAEPPTSASKPAPAGTDDRKAKPAKKAPPKPRGSKYPQAQAKAKSKPATPPPAAPQAPMADGTPQGLFFAAPPGLEPALEAEARALGFADVVAEPGGVAASGDWSEVWRANLMLRGAGRVLVRVGTFRAMHVAQLDKRARRFPWELILRPDVPIKVEATCKRSKIYHAGAAVQRVETAISETLGAPIDPEANLRIMVRIEDDLCTISLDSSGEPLHKRGYKEFVGKAAMRESMAALFLRDCGFDGREPLVDPMCGSGTFPLEAASIAAQHLPGATRRFAFQDLLRFDAEGFADLRRQVTPEAADPDPGFRAYGSDRDAGAIRGATANAERAGLAHLCQFTQHSVSDLQRPEGPPGLVMINPPYGGRIGNKKMLYALYAALGRKLSEDFSGWRVGIITTDVSLIRPMGIKFPPPGPPVAHGGLKVRLWQAQL
ncbi:class I SAM-dependent RNA methyltransferase [Roseovarius sp. C7]|uniref:class I SAM-dependent RNA methyltransferase n=1 Tax=Roseovarius sp. C7 TaxID=3398643 RepID=UPI0039F5B4DF